MGVLWTMSFTERLWRTVKYVEARLCPELIEELPRPSRRKLRLETIGKPVRVTQESVVEEGIAEGVNPDGSLVIRRGDGTTATIIAGDVTLRG